MVERNILPEIMTGFFGKEHVLFHSDYLVEIIANTKISKSRKHHLKDVVLVTGPSGAGKDTIINALPEEKFVRWRTWTTRTKKREDELLNDPYVRATNIEFANEEKLGNFIETNPYATNRYGTHKREAKSAFLDGRVPVLRVDPNGANTFLKRFEKKEYPFDDAVLHVFYIVPPSLEELKRRLAERDITKQEIGTRYKVAVNDLPHMASTQYILINERGKIQETATSLVSHLEAFRSSS